MREFVLSVAVALATMGMASAAEGLSVSKQPTHIEAQALDRALQSLASARELALVYKAELVAQRQAPEVNGDLTVDEALRQLLTGTGLTFQFLDEKTVTIVPAKGGVARTSRAAGEDVSVGAPAIGNEAVKLAQTEGTAVPASQSSNENKLEEVVVTAQKRKERLKDVPISISVLGGAALDNATSVSVNDALRSVPGVASYNTAQGGMTKFSMRGVTSNPSLFNGGATIGYYFDEIPFAFARFPVSPDANAYDLERIEVLRGPQGTLYGASSLNGVVRVITNDADLTRTELKSRAMLSSTKDGGENYRIDAAANLPIVQDKLAVRAVAGYSKYDGWFDQPLTGRKDVNEDAQKNLRLKVHAAPTEKLDIELMTWISRDHRDAPDVGLDDRTAPTRIPELIDTRFDAHDLIIRYEFPAFSILSSTSHMEFKNIGNEDVPLDPGDDDLITRILGEFTSEEVRLTSTTGGPWKWTAGALYRDGKDQQKSNFTQVLTAFYPTYFWNVFTSKSYAAYGELTRALFDKKLEITGGLRYFNDKSASNELDTGDILTDPPYGKHANSFHALTPRAVIAYHSADQLTVYASYSGGFRSGFAQSGSVLRQTTAAPDIRPDRLHNFEIGVKGQALENKLNYELAGYRIHWQDTIQVVAVNVDTPNGPVTFYGAVNAEAADGFGVDATATLNLTDNLSVGGTFSWNNLEFAQNVFSGTDLIYPKDTRLPESPETTAGGQMSYSMPLGNHFTGQFNASVDYTSRMLFRQGDGSVQYGNGITRARTSFSLMSHHGWSAMAFVDNLTDNRGRIRDASIPPGQADRLRPRTFGLQVDLKF